MKSRNRPRPMKLFALPWQPGRRRAALLLALVVPATLALAAVWAALRLPGHEDAQADGAWVPVQAQPVAQAIVAEGPLAAASAVSITAPFEGRIVRRWVQPGDQVQAGAPLLELDAAEVEAELREAQAAQIRARQELAELLDWSRSAEVAGARRQFGATQDQMQAARSRLAEARALFDKGIVARTEVDSAQSDLENATQQWQSASDGLASTLRKGSSPQVRMARLEAEARSARVRLLQERLAQAILVAPQAGVVLPPPADSASPGTAPRELEAGAFVSARDMLAAIGDTSMLLVRAQLDEFDAVRVRPGLPVQVTLSTDETAALQGELQRVSAQGRRESGSGGPGGSAPMFEIQVLIREVPPALRPRLRLGLTARLQMVVDPGHAALTVPLAAVRMDSAGGARVTRRSPDGVTAEVAIRPGPTTGDHVVVKDGLAGGDAVWVPHAADSPPPQDGEEADPANAPSRDDVSAGPGGTS
jgi:HlyD family secretion protein